MAVERLTFEQLPEEARKAVESRVGPFLTSEMGTGESSGVASLLWLPDGTGKVFLKGLPEHHERVRELDVEAMVNPFLPAAYAPKLLWQMSAGGWRLLGFQGLTVRPWSTFHTGSHHLEPAAEVLRDVSTRPAPSGIGLTTAWDRWSYYLDDEHEPLFQGDRLLHGDPAATNFLTDADGRAWLVDWAWAARGPGWIDAALWGFRVALDGRQTCEAAARWASTVPAFHSAPREAIRLLAEAEALSWQDHVDPAAPTSALIARRAREWADFWAR